MTSTNVLVNTEETQRAKQLKDRIPDISLGVHWNVTAGRPVSPMGKIPSLVDSKGNFVKLNEFKRRVYNKTLNMSELEYELFAQYEIYTSLCGKAQYWNTHQNSALCMPAYKAFKNAAKKCGIACTRNFQRVYIDYDRITFSRKLREIFVRSVVNVWFGSIISNDFTMPEGRLFPFTPSNKGHMKRLINSLYATEKKSVEIVLHPSTVPSHPLFGNVTEERVHEYEFFKSEEVVSALKGKYNLCGFKDLL